jgi:hypothetical protein
VYLVSEGACKNPLAQDSAPGGSPHAAAVAGAMAEMTDAEIAAAIKTTMNRLQTMSLPLSLLRGAGSADALAEAVKARTRTCMHAPPCGVVACCCSSWGNP